MKAFIAGTLAALAIALLAMAALDSLGPASQDATTAANVRR